MNLFALYLITALNLVHMFGSSSLWNIPLNNCRVVFLWNCYYNQDLWALSPPNLCCGKNFCWMNKLIMDKWIIKMSKYVESYELRSYGFYKTPSSRTGIYLASAHKGGYHKVSVSICHKEWSRWLANRLKAVMLRVIQQEVKYLSLAQWSDRNTVTNTEFVSLNGVTQILKTSGFYLACITVLHKTPHIWFLVFYRTDCQSTSLMNSINCGGK